MAKQNEVIINGVRYVPVVESSPDMEAIKAGLITSFCGNTPQRGEELDEKAEGLTVRVFDDGEGVPLDDVLADIADELSRKNAGVQLSGTEE